MGIMFSTPQLAIYIILLTYCRIDIRFINFKVKIKYLWSCLVEYGFMINDGQSRNLFVSRYLRKQTSRLSCLTCSTRCWSRPLVKGKHQTKMCGKNSLHNCFFSPLLNCLLRNRFLFAFVPDCKRLAAVSWDNFVGAPTSDISVWLGLPSSSHRFFFAALVALRLNPVSPSVGRSFKLA